MTNTTATAEGLYNIAKDLKDYFSGYRPDMKKMTYNYSERSGTMKFKITVPDNRSRWSGNVEIPLHDGYQIQEILAGGFDPIEIPTTISDDKIIIDPKDLPSEEEYMVEVKKKNLSDDKLHNIVGVEPSTEPKTKGGIEEYWLEAYLKDPAMLVDIYDVFEVENIDFDIQVGVQRCFSQSIPQDLIKGFERTRDLIRASNEDDVHEVKKIHKLRKGTQKYSDVDEESVAQFIESLASAESLREFVSVDDPYNRKEISTASYDLVFPERIQVGVVTDLDLDQQAADGTLRFHKNDYQNYIEGETEDFVD